MQLLCDGCNAVIPEETPPRGHSLKAYYCEKCDGSVLAYMLDRDALHTQVAGEWKRRHEKLRGLWIEGHPNGRLPDE